MQSRLAPSPSHIHTKLISLRRQSFAPASCAAPAGAGGDGAAGDGGSRARMNAASAFFQSFGLLARPPDPEVAIAQMMEMGKLFLCFHCIIV